ncbi:MAG: sensor histidine kinase [Burkholderiaceae bacterium]|nr:sensor histidine kinase [Burkholderiaceae bacterium]
MLSLAAPCRRGLTCLLIWLGLAAAPAMATVQVLDRAQVTAASASTPPAAPGAERPLPDLWAQGADSQVHWYRVPLAPLDASQPQALYVERACTRLQVFVDGRLFWRTGTASACPGPLLLPLPLTDGSAPQVLDLRVEGAPLSHVASRAQAGGLSPLRVGPQSELAPLAARATVLQVQLPQALAVSLLLTGGFVFLLGWRHREQSHLAYFGALCIGWALVEVPRWWPALGAGVAVLEFLHGVMLALVTLAAVQFLLREARWRSRSVSRALALQSVLMPMTLVAAGPARLHMLTALWLTLFALEIAAAAAFHLHLRRRLQGRWPALAAFALGAAGTALLVQLAGRYAPVPAAALHATALVAPLALLLVALRLVRQHGRALQASEATRVNLEARIRDATAEIERNFRQMTELRVEQVTEKERKRIAADLHDDLGAKLLTIVHTSEDPRISTLAREALEEMRLSVRGLTGKPVPLANALGDWRAELMSRLSQSGIEAEWESPDDLPQTLSARAYVQTTRILRESTSNIIKHSGATRCSFTCDIADGDLQLVIQDNGHGIPMELDGRLDRGHGMMTMKQRAKQMQGQCLVESGPGYGTVIRLTLPLDRATQLAP